MTQNAHQLPLASALSDRALKQSYNYDNLRSLKLAWAKDLATYVYDTNNRLTSVLNTGGAAVHSFAYDLQGNLSNKNSVPHDFDFGNRLRAVPGLETYRYDGLGRRVMSAKASGAQTLWQYSQAGQLLFAWKGPTAQTTHEYVYLAGSLVATIDHAWPSNAITATKYQHTDALGSPIAMSNEAGTVIERTNYDPYGGPINKTIDGIGYTGHVMDGLTGLTNMQQRYYDQGVGRFLSVDPVTASSVNGGNFNRYWYANNNPYKFVDPDGRVGKSPRDGRSICATQANCQTIQLMSSESPSRRLEKAAAHIAKVERKLESRGNSFESADESARFFRDNFADEGRYLQLEFGANAEPGTNAIVDIVHSPEIDRKSGVGTQINIPMGFIGGASFHTHPDITHANPGFSWGDIVTGRSSGNDFDYVFYGSPLSVGRRWDIRATSDESSASIYHYQDIYAPAFK